MKGDFTRFTFDPKRHYSRVLMQQGRVILDADWNEQADIQKHIQETEVVDIVGPSGSPIDIAGFGVEVAPGGQDLIISSGRMYVDGILCELDENKQYFEIVTFPSEEQVKLPSLNIDDNGLEKDQWVEISVEGDLQPQVLKVVQINEAESILTFNEKVNDNLREEAASFGVYIKLYSKIDNQLDIDVGASGTYLAYLDVWERHITSVEEDGIREKALDGPDTSTRVKTEWRVKLMSSELEKKSCRQASLKLMENLTNQKNSRLAVRLKASQGDLAEDPCAALSGTAYRGLENQLYRVEIHEPGVVGKATFKWSRNNGAIAFAIVNFISDTEANPKIYNKIRLQQLGWDQELRIQKGDWVEVSGDKTELLGKPGTLARVEDIDEADMILTITADVAKHVDESNPKVRRWDINEGDLEDPLSFNGILTKSSSESDCWTELEDGIEVCFKEGDNYQTGDYWMIVARNTGEIEWPQGENDFVPKFGIKHHHCLLAILNRNQDGKWNKEKDCRKLFPPLTDMIFLSYAGGDGQEAMPGYKLPAPFRVRVSRGEQPVEGAEIAFEIMEGQAVIDPAGSVLTGKDGIAQCTCQLNSNLESHCLRVRAALIDVVCPDENGVPSHPSIIFNANASLAEEVAYAAPVVCSQLKDAKTVKDAIDGLCRQVSFSCIGGDGQEAMPGHELPGPLRVRAARGSYPVVGAIVRFKIEKEKGLLSARSGETGSDELNISTDENGIAACFCNLKKDATIEASLQEPSLPDQSYIRFNANASVAEEVAYAAPTVCTQLNNAKTVKDAIDGLCRQVSFSCVGGDGQEAMPGYELPGPLRVRVARGSYPVVGAIVRFKIEKEKGLLSTRSGETGRDELNVTTDENGIAACFCNLKKNATIEARLQEPSLPDQSSIRFNANVSLAEEVAYAAPAVCSQLKDAKTVKDAIDGLCRQVSFSCVGGDGQETMPGYELPGSLRVRVARGSYPVVGAIVRFKIETEKGLLGERSGETGRDELTVHTDENGIAACFCNLKKDATIEASLQDPALPDQSSIRFNANVSLAEEVAYAAPIAFPQLADIKTVKDALNKLCLRVASPLTTWVHGNSLQVEKMAGEITVVRENYATVVKIPKNSKARMHFSIPTIQSPSGAVPVVQEALIRLKASSLSIAAYVYDGENPISDKVEIAISQNWETKRIILPDKQITTGLGISIIAECTEGSGQIELSAAGCKILSNW